MQDEQQVLARARAHDVDALAHIHDTYYTPVFRYIAFRVGDRHVAEDLTGDVFMRLLAALHAGTAPHTTVRGWLYGVAAHVVSDHQRKQYRVPLMDLDDALPSAAVGPHEAAERQLVREDLRHALRELTDEQQQVLALRFGNELPIGEVARILGKTVGAVKQLQARAVGALARKLSAGMVDE